ncbi:MAG: hypothetical protein ACLFR2_08430 [Candidatus Kapaibacterium sp.]
MKLIFSLALLIFMASMSLSAQILNQTAANTLLKGVVLDEYTGKPLGVEIMIEGGGKKIKTQSNDSDGSFEQLLTSGIEYEITFIRWDVWRETEIIDIKKSSGYEEKEMTFKAKKLTPGKRIFVKDAFKPGTDELKPEIEKWLIDFKTLMRFNRSIEYNFITKAPDDGLAQQRMAAMDSFLDVFKRYKRKISLQMQTGDETQDLVIEASKVENIFD